MDEALGLPRPWDQQLSLRMQQVLAVKGATSLLDEVPALGLARPSTSGKSELVRSNAERLRRIESGEQKAVGVNAFTSSAPFPAGGREGGILVGCPVRSVGPTGVAAL
jgi:ethylmalonyl-CoA mutase